ncbi:MAG TPA: hypothetical protein VGI21_20870 [Streptosporangiaceae bacterium]
MQHTEDQGRVGRVMDNAPFPGVAACRKTPTDNAGNNQQHNNVRSNCSFGHVKSAVLGQERNERIQDVHVLCLRFLKMRSGYLEHDVDDEERQRTERNRTVDGLSQHPVPRRHHDPVGRHDPHADRTGKG